MIRVTVWNEGVHEVESPEIAAVYPHGIHGQIKSFLDTQEDIEVRTATLNDPDCGLPPEVLENTDVLIWWGHKAHDEVPDELVERVHDRVLRGMGFIALHSAHFSKPFKRLMGTSCALHWRDGDFTICLRFGKSALARRCISASRTLNCPDRIFSCIPGIICSIISTPRMNFSERAT